jgi:PAS domain S-box-containing protein
MSQERMPGHSAFSTERKQAETALRESEQRLRWIGAVVESSDDAIVSKNLDGIITSWNKGAERLFNYTAEEAIGQPITMIIPQDRLDEERMILARIRRGERLEHFETVRQPKHGGLISISLTVSPVKNSEGKIVGASKVARDISEQKRNQEHISVLAREAEHREGERAASGGFQDQIGWRVQAQSGDGEAVGTQSAARFRWRQYSCVCARPSKPSARPKCPKPPVSIAGPCQRSSVGSRPLRWSHTTP